MVRTAEEGVPDETDQRLLVFFWENREAHDVERVANFIKLSGPATRRRLDRLVGRGWLAASEGRSTGRGGPPPRTFRLKQAAEDGARLIAETWRAKSAATLVGESVQNVPIAEIARLLGGSVAAAMVQAARPPVNLTAILSGDWGAQGDLISNVPSNGSDNADKETARQAGRIPNADYGLTVIIDEDGRAGAAVLFHAATRTGRRPVLHARCVGDWCGVIVKQLRKKRCPQVIDAHKPVIPGMSLPEELRLLMSRERWMVILERFDSEDDRCRSFMGVLLSIAIAEPSRLRIIVTTARQEVLGLETLCRQKQIPFEVLAW